MCQREDPLPALEKKHPTNNIKAQRDIEHGYVSALGLSLCDNTPQGGQVSGEEHPCVPRSPWQMPFNAERKFCCRPGSSAEASQEKYVAVDKQTPVSKTS